jgi:copper chaperone
LHVTLRLCPAACKVSAADLTWIKKPHPGAADDASPAALPARPEASAMQFELTAPRLDANLLAAALRQLDPEVKVVLEAHRGKLEVISTATAGQVLVALEELGCVAKPLDKEVHISGGSTCCGHCA